MKVKLKVKGDWNKSETWLQKLKEKRFLNTLDKYGREGVAALSSATPVDSGVTASSWSYRIVQNEQSISLEFLNNSETYTGIPIIILLHYGHGNGHGGYVRGRDFINPIVQPLFDKVVDELFAEIRK